MHHGSSIIVVGPPEFARRVAHLGELQVVAFGSLEELDRWRDQQRGEPSLLPDVLAALREIGSSLEALPRKLRKHLEFLAAEECVPPLSALETQWGSRLIEGGLSRKEAARRAGFTSVAQLRHALRR